MTRLRVAAIAAFGLHLLAGLAMALVLRHGLETNPDFQDRLAFIVNQRALWIMAWLTWTAAAIAILYFYITFESAHQNRQLFDPLLRLAVLLTAAAIAADLAGQAIEVGILPAVAERALKTNTGIDLFTAFHRTAVMLSGYAANGLYSISAFILTWTTRRAYPVWVWTLGIIVGASGLLLSAAVLFESISGMFWTNVVLVPCILLWLVGVATQMPSSLEPRLPNKTLEEDL